MRRAIWISCVAAIFSPLANADDVRHPSIPKLEAWADSRLPVVEGLEVWLDAAQQKAACRAFRKAAPTPGEKFGQWFDSSGHGRHVAQQDDAKRPKFVINDGHAAFRFDGDDDYLDKSGLASSTRDLTVIIVGTPFSNVGMYRGFVSLNRQGEQDYRGGFNIDQSASGSARFNSINLEGAGSSGHNNVMEKLPPIRFGTVTRLAVTSKVDARGTQLYVNGKRGGHRDRNESTIGMDSVTIAGRCYNHGGPPQACGFFDGDLAEVLIYNRVLSEEELQKVDAYLSGKHGVDRVVQIPLRGTRALVTVADPPAVQMLVPGFSVKELPLKLTNVNNLKYRPDGKLVAVAYDGKIHLLTDTDGDSLEDHAEEYGDVQASLQTPIGMAIAPAKYGDFSMRSGVFIAGKGKAILVADTDGDDKSDREIVLASGWTQLDHGVDALGIAYDPRDDSVYFGLGTAAFTNGYQLDAAGKSQYSLTSQRGTILRVPGGGKEREIFCTGIRFPVALAFNANGDLFCTDQEGATWMPNGNPLDELLFIERDRHYGFPPRHPRHLPSVIDEPSVAEYSPQHQSTCGLNFNESVNGGPVFGPAAWQGDAIVTGYSRGKLYRTDLLKTPVGYVSRNHLLASLNMLCCDACVSPQGDLVVCVHKGGPDWGAGPRGEGKIYKIRHSQRDLAQPTALWAQSPQELYIAFDRPLQADQLREVGSHTSIEFGKYVAAGDRFEAFRPGYQVVQEQLRAARNDLTVHGVSLTPDRRTLIVSTAPQILAQQYAITLPGLGRPAEAPKGELRQVPESDLLYNLGGVSAEWKGEGDKTWRGWLPHLDSGVARRFTQESAMHDDLWQASSHGGKWKFDTALDLWQMLRPMTQPGAQLDHVWPQEQVTLTFRAPSKLIVTSPAGIGASSSVTNGEHSASITFLPKENEPLPLHLEVDATDALDLAVTYQTNEDRRPRALQTQRFLLPWAKTVEESTELKPRELPAELAGGNWARGRQLFFGDQAGCAKCHTMSGQGGKIGPNLSNLPHRDLASVRRDIEQPSFAINPDHLSYNLTLNDGRVLTGIVQSHGDQLTVGDTQGKLTTIVRGDVESMSAAPISIMPEGIPKLLGPEKMRDLFTFLLTPPPTMPLGGTVPPPARPRAEVEAVLAGSASSVEKSRPLHLVLVGGPKDHGPGEHDYPAWQLVWKQLLSLAENVRVTTATGFPSNDDLQSADALVFFQLGQWTPERAAAMDAFFARGGGAVYIHFAVAGDADPSGMAERIGLAWRGGQSKFRHGPLELDFRDSQHPIARNLGVVHLHDESYWQLVGDPARLSLLASGLEEGKPQPLLWTTERGKGRVFVSIPGHFSWTFDDPIFRIMLLRGIAWTAGESVDRFNDLVTAGARVGD